MTNLKLECSQCLRRYERGWFSRYEISWEFSAISGCIFPVPRSWWPVPVQEAVAFPKTITSDTALLWFLFFKRFVKGSIQQVKVKYETEILQPLIQLKELFWSWWEKLLFVFSYKDFAWYLQVLLDAISIQ